jgi:GH24 family phage-related lysozyme (muramidase)
MRIGENGLKLIKHFEGFRNKPYRCAAGLFTVGYGHLIGDGLSLPDSWNRTFTVEECNALLASDVRKFERGVGRYINVQLTQNQFDAIVVFAFNLGLGTLQRSTLRAKLNRGDISGALKSWEKYNKAAGKVLRGLVLRRQAEIELFKGI